MPRLGRDGGRPARPLTVMTYNIHHGAGIDGVLDLERIAVLIEKSGADVIGLQEVDRHWDVRSNWVDQPAWFAQRLKMHYAYAANLDLPPVNPGEPRRQYGTAILSKYPIKDFTNTLLPLYPTGEQRGLGVASIKVRGADLRFANTHLTSNNNAERLEQAQKVVELLGTSKVPTLLVGDLNATPDAPEIKTLTAVLADTWTEVGVGPGYTIEAGQPDQANRLPAPQRRPPPDDGRRPGHPGLRPPPGRRLLHPALTRLRAAKPLR